MSEDGRVMPTEVVLDTALEEVTPSIGKEALGKWRAPNRKHHLDTVPGSGENPNGCRAVRYNYASKGRM